MELSCEELLEALYSLVPDMRGSAHVHWYSSSSFVYDKDSGEQLSGAKGQRVYIFVESGADIPRAAKVLLGRAWLEGFGTIKISKSGHLLQRCALFDVSVYQPNRIDFCADPICHPPLESRRPPPTFYGDETLLLDTVVVLPDLSDDELREYQTLVQSELQRREPEAERVKNEWANEQVGEAIARGMEPDTARKVFNQAVSGGILGPEFQLINSEGESVTVAEILADPAAYDQHRFRDPLEPDYRDDERIAVAFTVGIKPRIYSHAHGGRNYRLTGKPLSAKLSGGDRHEVLMKIARHFGDHLLAFADEDVPYFLNDNYRLVQLDVPKTMRLIDSYVDLQKFTQQKGWVRTDCTEQLAKLFIGAHPSDLPQIIAAVRQPTLETQPVVITGATVPLMGFSVAVVAAARTVALLEQRCPR
jgi:hypothetical protein